MPPAAPLRRALQALVHDSPFVYVDCGARSARLPRWLRPLKETIYVGFEADAEECARLNASARPGHRYVPAFLAGSSGARTFYVTASPACASLLRPNAPLLARFAGLEPLFRVEREQTVQTTTLDECLRAHGVPPPDFLELDTQGSELEILMGADATLPQVLGVRAEVEFAPMYVDQPLFADVDGFLRTRGFQLVDLWRHWGRRDGLGLDVPTRGQLLWGHALYLRDARDLPPERAARLAVAAALLDRPDVADEALRHVVSSGSDKELRRAASAAQASLRPTGEGDGSLPASVGRTTWRD